MEKYLPLFEVGRLYISFFVCCSYNIPPTPQVGVYIPENFVKFLPKYTPYHVIIFVKMSFKNCSTNEYMNEFVVILKLINLINLKNGKIKNLNFANFQIQYYKNFSLS